MSARGPWQGMLAIARFNWPMYAAAGVVMVTALLAVLLVEIRPLAAFSLFLLAGAVYFVFVSLGVSHLVYDRSDLYRWRWLARACGDRPLRQAVFCHAGFDEASAALRERNPETQWTILDHYDAGRMTEPSIHRARALYPPVAGTLAAPYDSWPAPGGAADAVFGLLAIHELRSVAERSAWFREARRCLRPGGRVILVEHVRDFANFLAFGPGFLHFHSVANWRRSWEAAGLRAVDAFRLTPWLRVFVLTAP